MALYLQLGDEEQNDAERIQSRLLEAFTDSPFVAFGKLVGKRWEGEQVDVFANELMRLGGLAGFTGESLEKLVKLSFVNGFPDAISCELQQVQSVIEVGISELISRARILTSSKVSSGVVASATGLSREMSNTTWGVMKSQQVSRQQKGCFKCGGPHRARNCHANGEGPGQREVICFRCQKSGHIASRCSEQIQGNGQRVTGAPAVTRSQ